MQRYLLVVAMCLAACSTLSSRAQREKEVTPPPAVCSTGWAPLDRVYLDGILADRYRGQNVYQLPWTDTLPPRRVTDAKICRRAAEIWHHSSAAFARDTVVRAYVVRAGGLYFVQGWPPYAHGNPMLILDRKFRTVTMIAWLD